MLSSTIHGLRGEVLTPLDDGYDEARRVFNGMVDRRPALVVRCTNAFDVEAAVRHARRFDLPISVHGGGHAVTGDAVADDALMIDLRPMKGVTVRPETRLVRAQGGLTWGEFDAALEPFGLAVTGGRIPSIGVAGLTLGSGNGWLERKLGLTADSLLSVQLVTAEGELVEASDTENADLFWGLRGGGGNFGIVTRLDFRAHAIAPQLYGGMVMHPHDRAPAVLAHFRDFMAGAPDEVGGGIALMSAPPEPFVPEAARGKPVLGLTVLYAGPPEEGAEVLRPLVEFGRPLVSMLRPMPYTAMQQLTAKGAPSGQRNLWRADFLRALPDAAIEALVEHTSVMPSPRAHVLVIPGGGAVARVPEHATAFSHRRAPWNVHVRAMWGDAADDEACTAWVLGLAERMRAYATGGPYLNYLGDEGNERVRAAFGQMKYRRLVALKDRFDPDNVFHLNQNIPPSRLLA